MRSLNVSILASEIEQPELRAAVDSTGAAHVSHCSLLPRRGEGALQSKLRQSEPDVVLIAVSTDATAAVNTIAFVHAAMPDVFLVAVGEAKPQLIVEAMRAGAGEFLELPLNTEHLREAFSRYLRQVEKKKGDERGRLISFVDAKGGSGATVGAVNTALTLADKQTPVALLEIAPGGDASLHLNVKPMFTVADVFANFHRLDQSLLKSFLTDCGGGLQLLSAAAERVPPPRTEEFVQLLDALTSLFRYVVMDASSRLDELTRIVCDFSDRVVIVAQADVVSLWSAAMVRKYLTGESGDKRFGLLLNRYEKLPGFDEQQIETIVGSRIIGKIMSQYGPMSRAIENGTPVVLDPRSDLGRSFKNLTLMLAGEQTVAVEAKPKRKVS